MLAHVVPCVTDQVDGFLGKFLVVWGLTEIRIEFGDGVRLDTKFFGEIVDGHYFSDS